MSKQLATLLQKAGVFTQPEIDECIQRARKRNCSLWDLIIEEKQVSEEALADAFASLMKLPRVRLATVTVEPEAIQKVKEDLARKHTCLPLKIENKALLLAMANPSDVQACQDLEFATGMRLRTMVASRTEVLDGIEEHYAGGQRANAFLANIPDTDDLQVEAVSSSQQMDLDEEGGSLQAAEQAPVIRMCNMIVVEALKVRASDIHIEPALNAVQVRFRVDGLLREYMQVPKWMHSAVVTRLKVLAKLDISERRVPQDGRIKVQHQGKPTDLRVSTLPTHYGEKVVMRVLGSSAIPVLESMGYSKEQIGIMSNALGQPQGLILVTGPTGSGKSTTLYSMLSRRCSPEVNIVTVEDPIEYQLAGVNQVQVNVKAGLTFASCLRSILRQDPDVVLLGEIRDLETAEIAFHAAMTGHLVLSTLHTNGTLPTIARLLDLGVEAPAITSSIMLITAQRLARRICLGCKEAYTPSSGLLEKLRLDEPNTVFYRGKGCQACGQSGYAGRVGIYELLSMTPKMQGLINRKAPEIELRKAAGIAGTRFLLEDAMEKVRQGVTTLDEVLRVIQLQEEEIVRCPQCSAFINLDFSTCPYCMHALRNVCSACGQELKLDWGICPYCNAQVTARKPVATPKAAADVPEFEVTADERPESPQAPAPAPIVAAAPGLAPVTTASAPVKTPYILVVDDDDGIKKVIKKALQQLPLEVEIEMASDGQEALEKVEVRPPDLVLLDVMMPGMGGFTLCQKLREGLRTAFVPIMMLTADANESNRTKGFLLGTDDYVSKPFSVPDLNARVMRLLRRTYGL